MTCQTLPYELQQPVLDDPAVGKESCFQCDGSNDLMANVARKWPLFHMLRESGPFLRSGQDAWQGPYLKRNYAIIWSMSCTLALTKPTIPWCVFEIILFQIYMYIISWQEPIGEPTGAARDTSEALGIEFILEKMSNWFSVHTVLCTKHVLFQNHT